MQTDSSAKVEEHCTNAQSNDGMTGGACEGACLTIQSRCLMQREIEMCRNVKVLDTTEIQYPQR